MIKPVYTALMAIVMLLTSCVHREFDYESNRNVYIDVVFDWSNEPEANPATMTLYLFPQEGGEPLRFEFAGRDGGTIRIAPGVYDAICMNSDQRDVNYRGAGLHSTFELTTSEVTTMDFGSSLSVRSSDMPKASDAEDQSWAKQPPLLWSASLRDVTVNKQSHGKRSDANPELRMMPDRIVETYLVTIRHINNIEYLNAMNATITNMAEGYFAADRKPNCTSVTLPLELPHKRDEATAEGQFLTFGHCPSDSKSHKLMVYAIMSDDSKYYYEFDVSDQAHNPPDADNIHHIVIDLLDLPKPIGGGGTGGLNPSVNDWQTEDVEIEM